jgi:hypothetical protein
MVEHPKLFQGDPTCQVRALRALERTNKHAPNASNQINSLATATSQFIFYRLAVVGHMVEHLWRHFMKDFALCVLLLVESRDRLLARDADVIQRLSSFSTLGGPKPISCNLGIRQ